MHIVYAPLEHNRLDRYWQPVPFSCMHARAISTPADGKHSSCHGISTEDKRKLALEALKCEPAMHITKKYFIYHMLLRLGTILTSSAP
jgi:hypothetical protein